MMPRFESIVASPPKPMGPVPHQVVCQFSSIGIVSSALLLCFLAYNSKLQPDVYILNSAVVAL